MRESGATLQQIADRLTLEGVPTPRCGRSWSVTASTWRPPTPVIGPSLRLCWPSSPSRLRCDGSMMVAARRAVLSGCAALRRPRRLEWAMERWQTRGRQAAQDTAGIRESRGSARRDGRTWVGGVT